MYLHSVLAQEHASIQDLMAKVPLTSLKASDTSLHSISLLSSPKSLVPLSIKVLAIVLVSTQDSTWKKIWRIRSLCTPSEPVCYKCTCTSNRFTTCRLSRFCHHCLISAIVGPRLLHTCKYISERTRTPCTLQGHLLHSCVTSKLAQVTSHLHVLTLVCQVTCEWYSIYTYMMYFPNQQKWFLLSWNVWGRHCVHVWVLNFLGIPHLWSYM